MGRCLFFGSFGNQNFYCFLYVSYKWSVNIYYENIDIFDFNRFEYILSDLILPTTLNQWFSFTIPIIRKSHGTQTITKGYTEMLPSFFLKVSINGNILSILNLNVQFSRHMVWCVLWFRWGFVLLIIFA